MNVLIIKLAWHRAFPTHDNRMLISYHTAEHTLEIDFNPPETREYWWQFMYYFISSEETFLQSWRNVFSVLNGLRYYQQVQTFNHILACYPFREGLSWRVRFWSMNVPLIVPFVSDSMCSVLIPQYSVPIADLHSYIHSFIHSYDCI